MYDFIQTIAKNHSSKQALNNFKLKHNNRYGAEPCINMAATELYMPKNDYSDALVNFNG